MLRYPLYQKAQGRKELSANLELCHSSDHVYGLRLLISSSWYNSMIATAEIPDTMKPLIEQSFAGLNLTHIPR